MNVPDFLPILMKVIFSEFLGYETKEIMGMQLLEEIWGYKVFQWGEKVGF